MDSNCVHVKFPDACGRKGQKNIPATDIKGIVEIVMLLQGQQAARVCCRAAELREKSGERSGKLGKAGESLWGAEPHAASAPFKPRAARAPPDKCSVWRSSTFN